MGGTHLSLESRAVIEKELALNRSVRQIAALLHTSHSTISRELLARRTFKPGAMEGSLPGTCTRSSACPHCRPGCTGSCRAFLPPMACERLNAAPFVCNGCEKKAGCRLGKMQYSALDAQKSYKEILSESRQGVNLEPEELENIRICAERAVDLHQSPYHIVASNPGVLQVSVSTLYRLIEGGLLGHLRRSNLKRAAKMKPRKGEKPQLKIERKCRDGRTLADLEQWKKKHPDEPVVEMDTVEGTRGGRCLLTLHLPGNALQLMFIRPANNAASVLGWFDELEKRLGLELFQTLFPAIRTDNGSEFSNPSALERSLDEGKQRTRIFYCDQGRSWQKPFVEGSNEYMRDVFPKGVSIPDVTQEKVSLAASHINSKRRKSLAGRSPVEIFIGQYGEECLRKLGLQPIPPQDANLTPSVLK